MKIFRKALQLPINLMEAVRGGFFTVHERPVSAQSIGAHTRHISPSSLPNSAIVIQGPIIHDRNFTLETIDLYRKTAAGSKIVLSTWRDEDVHKIAQQFGNSITILKNRKPEFTGPSNLNFQIVSAVAGIQAARQNGAQYILKTRTDQRMYVHDPIAFLYSLSERFPLAGSSAQNRRVISVSLDTFKFRIYGVSDMFTFGHADDMLSYWSADLINQPHSPADGGDPDIIPSESYLCSEFLMKMGRPLDWTIEDSWRALADHFCIIDEKSIDLFWFKYGRHREYRYPSYGGEHAKTEVSFVDWVLMGSEGAHCDIPTAESLSRQGRIWQQSANTAAVRVPSILPPQAALESK